MNELGLTFRNGGNTTDLMSLIQQDQECCGKSGVFWVFSALLFCQAEEAAAEITRKLEKQEKKRLKKEKKRLAALALASSENSSTPEECEEVHGKPEKKKELKPQETLQENGMEDPPVSLPKTKKKKAPKEELASDLEEMATSSAKRKKSSPKEEVASEPEEAASPTTPKKKRKFSEEPEVAANFTKSSTKKKKKSQKAQEDQNGPAWWEGHTLWWQLLPMIKPQ